MRMLGNLKVKITPNNCSKMSVESDCALELFVNYFGECSSLFKLCIRNSISKTHYYVNFSELRTQIVHFKVCLINFN